MISPFRTPLFLVLRCHQELSTTNDPTNPVQVWECTNPGGLPRLLELVYGFDEAGKFLAESEFVILSGGGLNPFVNEGQRQTAHGRIGL